jgi:hypothetical protein
MKSNESPLSDRPGGPKPWSEQARRSWKAWRNYYPSLAYARGDRRTFYIPIDEAANMAGLTRRNFYKRYLMSKRLPYVVKTWFHGRKMRRKSLVPRGAVVELLARELCQEARRHELRRAGLAIRRNAQAADLERELNERRRAGANGRNRLPGNDHSRSPK